jgi:hypothetical protein
LTLDSETRIVWCLFCGAEVITGEIVQYLVTVSNEQFPNSHVSEGESFSNGYVSFSLKFSAFYRSIPFLRFCLNRANSGHTLIHLYINSRTKISTQPYHVEIHTVTISFTMCTNLELKILLDDTLKITCGESTIFIQEEPFLHSSSSGKCQLISRRNLIDGHSFRLTLSLASARIQPH